MKNNTWVVLQREYMTRVKKKGFFVMTILAPILLVALMFTPALLMQVGGKAKTVALVDETGAYEGAFRNSEDHFEPVADTATAKIGLKEEKYDAILYIPQGSLDSNRQTMLLFYQQNEPSMAMVEQIESDAQNKLRMNLIHASSDIRPELFDFVERAGVDVVTRNIETGERSYTEVKSLLAYAIGFLIYGFIFLFGSQIMSGVIEEKSNRIIEVMISSVKPFQLLMGKVLGLALVGLTQLLLWGVLTLVLTMVVGMAAGGGAEAAQAAAAGSMPGGMDVNEVQATLLQIQDIVASLNLKTLLLYFLVYFLGGYLLYASLFAAVGSAVENQEDTNQFMWPITIPLLVGIIVVGVVLKDPYSPLAVWTSIIPFTSPIVMMARIPFGVPVWELALSLGLLVAGFIGTTWLAARIYRVGILMYGKKGSYKELWHWIRYRG